VGDVRFRQLLLHTVVITALYAPFFIEHVVPAGHPARNSLWSLAMALSTAAALLLSPFIGAVCDFSGRKKRFLLTSAVLCAGSTALLALAGPGDVVLAVGLIIVSNAAFMVGESLCASFLPEIATPKTMARVSALGWGLGYFGGLASLLLARAVIGSSPETAAFVRGNRLAMVATGVFFLVAATPTLLFVKNRSRPAPGFESAGWARLAATGASELRRTFARLGEYRTLARFLLAFTVYMAGMDVVVKFVGIYARGVLAFSTGQLVTLFLVLQISTAAGALLFGLLESRIGSRTIVMLTLAQWSLAVVAIHSLDALVAASGLAPATVFHLIGVFAGSAIGATQSSSRTIVGLLAPAGKSAEMFGFWGFAARLSAILGAAYGPVADLVGLRNGLLLVLAFFLGGAALLVSVRLPRGGEPASG
jgi:UMF1 family MFS transporter